MEGTQFVPAVVLEEVRKLKERSKIWKGAIVLIRPWILYQLTTNPVISVDEIRIRHRDRDQNLPTYPPSALSLSDRINPIRLRCVEEVVMSQTPPRRFRFDFYVEVATQERMMVSLDPATAVSVLWHELQHVVADIRLSAIDEGNEDTPESTVTISNLHVLTHQESGYPFGISVRCDLEKKKK